MQTIYGINQNQDIYFFSLEAAEEYVIDNNPEYCATKDGTIEYLENAIWEDNLITCEGCDTKILHSDMDECWVKPSCCDIWFCHTDCHY
jgi:hypothetical protein